MGCFSESDRDKELRLMAEQEKKWTKENFEKTWPFAMCCAPCSHWCFLPICLCPCITACWQRGDILDIEGKDYYSCCNLSERQAQIGMCDENSCLQSCNCLKWQFRGACAINTCICLEAFCCTQCAAQANRWSVRRLGTYESSDCEDCVVWCVYCISWTVRCIKHIYRDWICCAPCNPIGLFCYLLFFGEFCELADFLATCIYYTVLGCWQTQTCAAIDEIKAFKQAGGDEWNRIQQNKNQYVWVGLDAQGNPIQPKMI